MLNSLPWMKRLLRPINTFRCSLYDWMRFIRYSQICGTRNASQYTAMLTQMYHVLEKGLAMRDCRPNFGKANIRQMLRLLEDYWSESAKENSGQCLSAMHVLSEYIKFHEDNKELDVDEEWLDQIRSFLNKNRYRMSGQLSREIGGGSVPKKRQDIIKSAHGRFPELIQSRFSIRDFSGDVVPEQNIMEAIRWAQKSPSSCNRQCARVYIVRDRDKISEIMKIQGGARGFGTQIDKLLLVAGDLSVYATSSERNLVFVDAGLFAMSLILGMHFQGFATCALHWCVNAKTDRCLRKIIRLENAHTVVMLIGLGSIPENFMVAHSQRIPLDRIVFMV